MVAKVHTVAFTGIHATAVEAQIHLGFGQVGMYTVGLPDKAVNESRERVRAAFQSFGLGAPNEKITINLAPTDLTKEGSHYDLAIALGVLATMNAILKDRLGKYIAVGELSLDGTISRVNGVLPAAISANAAGKGLIYSYDNGAEALNFRMMSLKA